MTDFPYKKWIWAGVFTVIVLFLFADKPYGGYAPVIFWLIGIIFFVNIAWLRWKFIRSVNRTKPEYTVRKAFRLFLKSCPHEDSRFLNSLNEYESGLFAAIKRGEHYLGVCMILFVVFALLIFFRT